MSPEENPPVTSEDACTLGRILDDACASSMLRVMARRISSYCVPAFATAADCAYYRRVERLLLAVAALIETEERLA